MKELTVITDDDGWECLYIDGKAWSKMGECTVYATDLAEAADGDESFKFKHIVTEHSFGDYPKDLDAALHEIKGFDSRPELA